MEQEEGIVVEQRERCVAGRDKCGAGRDRYIVRRGGWEVG